MTPHPSVGKSTGPSSPLNGAIDRSFVGVIWFRSEDSAMASGLFHPAGVAKWVTDPRVGATARIYAKRFNAVEKAQAGWDATH